MEENVNAQWANRRIENDEEFEKVFRKLKLLELLLKKYRIFYNKSKEMLQYLSPWPIKCNNLQTEYFHFEVIYYRVLGSVDLEKKIFIEISSFHFDHKNLNMRSYNSGIKNKIEAITEALELGEFNSIDYIEDFVSFDEERRNYAINLF